MKARRIFPAFVSVTALFFAWGFISSNNDPLIAALIVSFKLSYSQALLIQLVSFGAFGLVSLPAAALLARVDAPRAIVIALAAMTIGCLCVALAARTHRYELILAALFLLASGITTLQVAANPLAAALGDAGQSHFRLTLAQAFNSLGVVLGVSFGSAIMLSEDVLRVRHATHIDPAQTGLVLASVSRAFLLMGAMLALLLAFFWAVRKPMRGRIATIGEAVTSPLAALRSAWAVAGASAIGLYVGAEVSVASVMINFLNRSDILDLSLETAGFYLANIYWMGALAGRFVGSFLLTRMRAAPLLAVAAVAAMTLCAIVVVSRGALAAYAALCVGLFNSIMFPTIFSITLERSLASKAATSGLLCLAISGGAVLPYAVGAIADHVNLSVAFAAPACAYVAIVVFALCAARDKQHGPTR